jgi:protocatechuate 3,4-dioxygenase beta subunit
MPRRVAPVLWLLAFCSAAPVVAQKDHAWAVIEGTVLGPDARPVAGARVFLQPSDGSVPHVARSDVHGHYIFSQLRPGFYDLRAQWQGRESDWKHNVKLPTGAQVIVTLKLKLIAPAH